MKRLIFSVVSIFFLVFAVSCGEKQEQEDENGKPDDSADAEEVDDGENIPECINEWKSVEIISNPVEHYNFKITTIEKSWKWQKYQDAESLKIYTAGFLPDSFVSTGSSGNIYVSGDLNGEYCIDCITEIFHIYKPDGKVSKYGINGIYNLNASFSVFDEEKEETQVLISFRSTVSKEDEFVSVNNYMILNFDSLGKWSATAWVSPDHLFEESCHNLVKSGEDYFVFCYAYLKNGGDAPSGSSYIVKKDEIYYKRGDDETHWSSFSQKGEKSVKFIENATRGEYEAFLAEIDTATLCESREKMAYYESQENEKFGVPMGFCEDIENRYYFFLLPGEETEEPEGELGIDPYPGYISGVLMEKGDGTEYFLQAGIYERINNKGQVTFFGKREPVTDSSGNIFFIIHSTGDLDADGVPSESELIDMQNQDYFRTTNSYIIALDKEMKPYIKILDNGIKESRAFNFYIDGDHLYMTGNAASFIDPEGDDRDIFVSRMKIDSIINEENLADGERVKIEKLK